MLKCVANDIPITEQSLEDFLNYLSDKRGWPEKTKGAAKCIDKNRPIFSLTKERNWNDDFLAEINKFSFVKDMKK